MGISIVIPTLNRYSDLKNTIKHLKNQTLKDFELIIIDQTDAENFEVLHHLDSRIIHKRSEIKSASSARNIGLLLSSNEIVLFMDDDVLIADKNFLLYHLSPYLEDERLPGVFGSVLELRVNQQPTLKRHIWSYNSSWGWLFFPQNYDKFTLVNSARSCNFSVRKKFALGIGGMDENFVKGAHREEADFCHRLTKKYGNILFSPKARLTHIGNASGGIRSWDTERRRVPAQHHFDGSWYYIFKNVETKHILPHLLSYFLFFFYKKEIILNPKYFFLSVYRTIIGIRNSVRMLKLRPRYINK